MEKKTFLLFRENNNNNQDLDQKQHGYIHFL